MKGIKHFITLPKVATGNWAPYQLKEIISLMKSGQTPRPKDRKDLTSFVESYLKPIGEATESRDWTKFEKCLHEWNRREPQAP